DLVGRVGERVEVVEQPDRLEPERLGLTRDLGRPLPCGGGIPAVVLAGPALWDDDADLHRVASPVPAARRSGRGAPISTVGRASTIAPPPLPPAAPGATGQTG